MTSVRWPTQTTLKKKKNIVLCLPKQYKFIVQNSEWGGE